MQNLTNFPNLIDRWLRYRFQTILVVCFLLWTPFLVAETLQVQHSCYPMIHWSGTLPAECQPKLSQTNSRPSKKAEPLRDRSQEQKQSPSPKPSPTSQPQQTEKLNPVGDVIKTAKEHPNITGGVIAIGVAGTMAVVTGAPLILAAGIGTAVWSGLARLKPY